MLVLNNLLHNVCTVLSCTLTDCFSYITLFLKFNSWTDLLAFAREPECPRRSTESRIGFKTKVALEVVGKVTYLIDLRTSRFLLQPKKTAFIFRLGWRSCQSMDIYEYISDMQITKHYGKIKKKSWEWSSCPHTRIFQTTENSIQILV